MKVRWMRDSIRLRITPTELETLLAGEAVHEGIAFPGMQFWNVSLRPSDAETGISSDQHGVYLSLSETDRTVLAQPETEGVYFRMDEPAVLRFYVEKDFPCIHPRSAAANETPTETFSSAPTEINGN